MGNIAGLSDHELEVLRLVADGLSTADIAARLGVSETTVQTHIGGMVSRSGFENLAQLALYARKWGLAAD
jgi:DNA-binding NarL/FixJ family response regulator